MKILFISSGKSGSVGEVVRNQGESLKSAGIEIEYYLIKPGLFGYLKAIPKLKKKYNTGNYDIAHSHYSLSGFTASLAGCRPLVVSLMGSDTYMSGFLRKIIYFFYKYRWDITILKTHKMKELLGMERAEIIPNGVDITRFKPIPQNESREMLNFPLEKKIIIFISFPNRPEKNIELAKTSLQRINRSDILFKHIYNVPNEKIPLYYNAADALLLTSKWEGSVNIVKEAMACNCPIISTNVGDVKWVLGDTEGCYITSFEPEDVADKIKAVLDFGRRTNGRNRIFNLGLDSENIADRLFHVYHKVRKGEANK